MNPFYLDLWQEELYDWERLKSKRIIDSLLKGIEMGDVLSLFCMENCTLGY